MKRFQSGVRLLDEPLVFNSPKFQWLEVQSVVDGDLTAIGNISETMDLDLTGYLDLG